MILYAALLVTKEREPVKTYLSARQVVRRLNCSLSVKTVYKPIRRGKPTRLLFSGIEDEARPGSRGVP
jgi:hypothetical protein